MAGSVSGCLVALGWAEGSWCLAVGRDKILPAMPGRERRCFPSCGGSWGPVLQSVLLGLSPATPCWGMQQLVGTPVLFQVCDPCVVVCQLKIHLN